MKYMGANWNYYVHRTMGQRIDTMHLQKKSRRARFEMLPLMDIVFLLLVFLIYAMLSMSVQKGMPVTLPVSTTSELQDNSILTLTIRQDGSLWLDKTPVRIGDLSSEIHRAFRRWGENNEPVLQIFADADLPYQKLFNVLDVLKQADIKKISLQSRESAE